MKKILPVLLLLTACNLSFSQSINQGTPIAEIFSNFHYSLNDTTKTTGFGIERALFGYNFTKANNFSATVILNIGSPEELAEDVKARRYAHFREAFVSYSKDKLTVNMGITKTLLGDYQQRFLGKRYIADHLLSMNGYGYVSDLGILAVYRFNELIKADASVMNGKGYSNLQVDNNLKISAGLIISPANFLFRIYGDAMKKGENLQSTLVSFAGYKNDQFTIGTELSHKANFGPLRGNDVWGFSCTGAINLTDKIQFFARYDISQSVLSNEESIRWNYLNDSDLAITGIEYEFTEKIKISLNYQGNYPHNITKNNSEMVFFNSLYRF